MVVRSYRRALRVDRRLYRVDRWPLPVPNGVPLRALAYFFAALIALICLAQLPLVGVPLGVLGPPHYLIAAFAIAALAMHATPDGRTATAFAGAWIRLRVRREHEQAGVHGGTLPTLWTLDAPELHATRIRGPARVQFNVAVSVGYGPRGRALNARPTKTGPRGDVVVLAPGERLKVRA